MTDIIDKYFSGDVVTFIIFVALLFHIVKSLPRILFAICVFIVLMHMVTNEYEEFSSTKKIQNKGSVKIADKYLNDTHKKAVCLTRDSNDVMFGSLDSKGLFYGERGREICSVKCTNDTKDTTKCLNNLFIKHKNKAE